MDIKKRKCEKCDSSQTRIRIIKNERICHTCGYIEKLDKNKKRDEDGN